MSRKPRRMRASVRPLLRRGRLYALPPFGISLQEAGLTMQGHSKSLHHLPTSDDLPVHVDASAGDQSNGPSRFYLKRIFSRP